MWRVRHDEILADRELDKVKYYDSFLFTTVDSYQF